MIITDSLADNQNRCSFELFKSNVCHRLKELGDIDFLIETLESGDIRIYYQRKWYPESLYLLAMADYISRVNGVEPCAEYDDLMPFRSSCDLISWKARSEMSTEHNKIKIVHLHGNYGNLFGFN